MPFTNYKRSKGYSLTYCVSAYSDTYANPIFGASVTVSGGYGANVTGSTNSNGYYALSVKPVNIGGPFALSFSVTSSYGNYNTIQGNITVTAPIVVPVDKVLAGVTIAGQTGTMPNMSTRDPNGMGAGRSQALTWWTGGGPTVFFKPQQGYYDGIDTWTYYHDPNLVPENIISSKTILGVTGTAASVSSIEFGNGSDGALTTGGTLAPNQNGMVVKQYTSINIPAGQTLNTSGNPGAMILYCTGNVTINGTISMDNMAPVGDPDDIGTGIISTGVSGSFILPPKGGTGGAGGAGGGSCNNYVYGGNGANGETGTRQGGGRGGPGGGGALAYLYSGRSGGAGAPFLSNRLAGSPGGYAGPSSYTNSWQSPSAATNGGAGGGVLYNISNSYFIKGGSAISGGGASGAGGGGGIAYSWDGITLYGINSNGIDGTNRGGGCLVIIAQGTVTINSGGVITAKGGDGQSGGNGNAAGTGTAGAGGGGGGGAGGGTVSIYYSGGFTNNGTIAVAGGTGGAGGAGSTNGSAVGTAGSAGNNGSAGSIVIQSI